MTAPPHSKECFLCAAQLSDANDSEEHIIPNSIGGRKTVKGFLCKTCNNDSGSTWDAQLAKQLNSIGLLLRIKRQRGESPSEEVETTDGQKLVLHSDGSLSPAKPTYHEESFSEQVRVSIQARSMEEAKRMLKGVKRKYPKLDLEKALEEVKNISSYPNDWLKLSLSLGGKNVERSAVKSAAALAVHGGLSVCDLGVARSYYIAGSANDSCVAYIGDQDFVVGRARESILHCVAVQGTVQLGMLVAYIEYYGLQRLLILLSSDYSGPDIKVSYAVDPHSGQEVPVEILFPESPDDIRALLADSDQKPAAVEAALNRVLPVALKRSSEQEQHRVISEAVEYAFKHCGAVEGELLTEANVNRLTGLMMQKLEPYLLHQIRSRSDKRNV
jgi:hypothetical protein